MPGASELSSSMTIRDALIAYVTESPLDVAMLDREGRLLAVSDSDVAATGIGRDKLLGARIIDLFGDAAGPLAAALAPSAIEKPAKLPAVRVVNPVGEVHWIQSSCSPWRDETGAVGGLICVIQNITVEQQALLELSRAEALLDAIVDSIPSILVVQDYETGAYVRVNRATEEFFGQSREEIVGRRSTPLAGAAAEARHWKKVLEAEAARQVVCGEEVAPDGAGQPRVLRNRRQIIEAREGARHILTVAEDITEERRSGAALQAALRDAEAANRAKSSFLTTISHEIRTPLNGVLGMAQVMAHDGDLSDVQRSRLNVIRQSGEALLAVLNDFLDLSKIEAGKLDVEVVEFDLSGTVGGACAGFTGTAANKNLALVIDTSDIDGIYLGDPTRIRQIVSNLVSNALKFTEAGEVRVSGARTEDGVQITVADTGPGMGEETLGRLFEKFVQADSSTTRRFGGTGLGLAICRELAGLMGGTIAASSRQGEGSTFTLSLPLARAGDREPTFQTEDGRNPDLAAECSSLQVLAAEDNEVNQIVLRALLQQIGIAPRIVDNGIDAVAAWATQEWDLILMDVQMPRMDGPTAAQIIRERERADGRSRTPILALTANAMSHQIEEYAACGMDGFVAKPIQISQLFAAIDTALRPARPDGPEAG